MTDLHGVEQAHSSGAVPRRGVTIVSASGARLRDDTGREWIDCSAAHGWAALGHGHPDVTEAIRSQAGRLVMLTESATNDMRAAWFSTLVEFLGRDFPATARGPLSRIAPANSGAEAVEAALKFARFQTGRSGVVAFTRGFHGRTFGALSATAPSPRRERFAPLLPDVAHVPFDSLPAADAAIGDRTGAVLVEVVQGEGGVHEAGTEFLRGLEQLCRERGALLIVDEIQTGFGRTGRWFASAHHGLNPDLVVLGKALGGGLVPVSMFLARDDVMNVFTPGDHGSTFGGYPLGAAVGYEALKVLEEDSLVERSDRLGTYMLGKLRGLNHPAIRDVRGRGLLAGIEFDPARFSAGDICRELMHRGVLCKDTLRNTVRFAPPFVIEENEIDEAVAALSGVLTKLAA